MSESDKCLSVLITELDDRVGSLVFRPSTAGGGLCVESGCGGVCGSGEGEQERVPGGWEAEMAVGRASAVSNASPPVCIWGSVLQHCLVALEYTLGNLWSSALQGDLRGRQAGRVTATHAWMVTVISLYFK